VAYEAVSVVEVRIWGQTVGAISDVGGAYGFQYTPEWKRGGVELSPLLMPVGSRTSVFRFPGLGRETFQGLPPMLADALPDRFGNSIIDAWLAAEGVDRARITPLDRLAYLGSRGMGALEFVPDRSPAAPVPTALELASLIETARAAVSGTLDDDRHSADALRQIISVGTSAGGARAKAVVTIDEATGEIRPGHALPRPGEGSWLLKFDGVGADHQLGESQQYTRIEYAYSLMARAAGIRMPETRLLAENGRAHFLTRRFDRSVGGGGDGSGGGSGDGSGDVLGRVERLHLQSLCGLAAVDFTLRGANDYAQLFTAAASLGLGEDDRTEIFRRMAFNVAAANHDDHSKNHAFLLARGGSWMLSPAYDITYARDADNIWLRQHLMSVNGKFTDITRADLLAVADRFAVPGAKAALRRVDEALDAWGSFAEEAGVSRDVAEGIGREFTRVG